MEVSVSSHIANKTAIMKKLQSMERVYTKDSLLPNSSEWHLAEHPTDVPDLLPTQGKSETSERKDNSFASDKQEGGTESRLESADKTGTLSEAPSGERAVDGRVLPVTERGGQGDFRHSERRELDNLS